MALARTWMSGTDLVRAKTYDSLPTKRRAECIELALFQIPQLEPVGFRQAKRVPCPCLIRIQPGAPDDYIVGLSRSVLVQFGKPLRRDDAGIASLAALAHQSDNRLGRFGFAGAALRTVNMGLVQNQ